MLDLNKFLTKFQEKIDLKLIKKFFKDFKPEQLTVLLQKFKDFSLKKYFKLDTIQQFIFKINILGILKNNFDKFVGFIYWLIFGKKIPSPFIANKNAYFIHAYKIRKETKTYSGLNVSADLTVKALQNNGFKAAGFGFSDDNQLDKILFEERPTHFIIKAFWVRKEKLELLATRYPSCQFIVVCHSKPSFLASENNGFMRFSDVAELSERFKNIRIASNNDDMADVTSKAYKCDVLYLPNLVEINEIIEPKEYQKVWGNVLKVGIFCAIRPMKNILNQALAAIAYCRENDLVLELHVLSGRTEMEGDVTMKNLRDLFQKINGFKFKLVEHPWLSHEEFIDLVKTMDIGMQASFTESFNIITADLISCGIPVITSPAIAWSPKKWMANPDDMKHMQQVINQWLTLKVEEKKQWLLEGAEALKEYNKESLNIYNMLAEKGTQW